jgi:protein SCO1/2
MKLGRALLWSTAAAAVAAGAVGSYAMLGPPASRPQFEGVDITGAPWGSGFELTDHLGRKRTLSDFRGKVVALFFGYTQCPDS